MKRLKGFEYVLHVWLYTMYLVPFPYVLLAMWLGDDAHIQPTFLSSVSTAIGLIFVGALFSLPHLFLIAAGMHVFMGSAVPGWIIRTVLGFFALVFMVMSFYLVFQDTRVFFYWELYLLLLSYTITMLLAMWLARKKFPVRIINETETLK